MNVAPQEDQQAYYFPMSFAQQRLWLFQQMQPDSAAYNITGALRLTGALDIAALEHALQQIVQRHEILRTTFRQVQGEPSQWVEPGAKLILEQQVLAKADLDRQLQVCREQAAQLAGFVFDLETGPLMKLQLLTLSEGEYVLLSVVHHIISDGWSMGVFVDELMKLYASNQQGQPAVGLPELEIQYGDYALWQREWFTGDIRAQQMDYWQKQLAGMPPLISLPTDYPRPPVQRFQGATTMLQLPAQTTAALKALASDENATLNMVLLTAYFVLLHRYSQEQDLVVGTPVANRNQHELEPLIGFFVNTLVLRAGIDPHLSFRALLQQVKAMALAAYDHQDCPFEQLVDQLKQKRSLSYSPLVQALFTYQNAPEQVFELPGVSISHLQLQRDNAQFDLAVMASENANDISLEFSYNTDLFKPETIEVFAHHFVNCCQAVSVNLELRPGAIPLLEIADYHAVFKAWKESQTAELVERSVMAAIGRMPIDSEANRLTGNAHLYVVDEDLNPLPSGLPGELCVGGLSGTCLSENSHGSERLLPDPFSSQSNACLYRTGYKVKFTSEQGFEFIYHSDRQGAEKRFRVGLGEMESVLRSHDAVEDVAIVAGVDHKQDSVLTAYIVSRNGNIELTELRDYLAERLPDYILPEEWQFLAELPLTESGEIDRPALQGRIDQGLGQEPLQAPENEIEEKLLHIWQQVLLLTEIGTEQNFFDLGGHSLNAIQIVSRIKQEFSLDMPMRTIFEKPSIKQLAEWILMAQFNALDDDEQEQFLDELAQLSDDELDSLI